MTAVTSIHPILKLLVKSTFVLQTEPSYPSSQRVPHSGVAMCASPSLSCPRMLSALKMRGVIELVPTKVRYTTYHESKLHP